MKKVIQSIAAIAALIIFSPHLFAGPFIKIRNIDTASSFPKIDITVTVQNVDRSFLHGLDERELLVYEDGYRVNYVKVTDLNECGDRLNLVFCIDSSKSISKPFLKSIKDSALDIMGSTGSGDRVAIYRFNDNVSLLSNFTLNRPDLTASIKSVDRHGTKTLLYNSIYDAMKLLVDGETANRAVVVFTDGKDEGSSITIEDVVTFSREASIPVYFITQKSSPGITSMGRLAKLTGGKVVYSKNRSDIAGMYRSILNMIKSRYIIRYQSILQPDGKTHQLEVRLSSGSLRDRDTAEFSLKRGIGFPEIFKNEQWIFPALVLLLLAVLILLIFFSARKYRGMLPGKKQPAEQPRKNGREEPRSCSITEGAINLEEADRLREEEMLTQQTPSFTYSDAWLIQKEGPETGKNFPLYWDETVLGRSLECSLIIDDEAVSARHAKIKSVRGAFYLFDLVSDNGTYLNGQKLLRPKALYDWDEIVLGRTHLIFRGSKIIS